MRRRLVTFAVLLALGLSAPAGAAVTQIGPPPVQGDCYTLGLQEGVNCYYGVGGMTFSGGKHVLRVGETTTATMSHSWDSFQSVNGNYIVRTVTRTLNFGDFELVGGFCPSVFYFSGSANCELKAVRTTGGWRTHGYTLSIGGSRPYEAGDYYRIIGPDQYEIGGTLRKANRASTAEEPAAGVTVVVSKVGGTDSYTTTSNLNVRYSVLVDQGTWKVRTSDPTLCQDVPGRTGCSRQPQTTTGPDREVNFTKPLPVKVSGKVTTKDGEPIAGAKIRARIDGEDTREVIAAKDGTYAVDDIAPGSEVVLDSPDGNVCPKDGATPPALLANGRCEKPTKTVTPDRDLTVDFEKPGCTGACRSSSSRRSPSPSRATRSSSPRTSASMRGRRAMASWPSSSAASRSPATSRSQ